MARNRPAIWANSKNRLHAQWTGAGINLKRLFKLFQGDLSRMRQVLMALI